LDAYKKCLEKKGKEIITMKSQRRDKEWGYRKGKERKRERFVVSQCKSSWGRGKRWRAEIH